MHHRSQACRRAAVEPSPSPTRTGAERGGGGGGSAVPAAQDARHEACHGSYAAPLHPHPRTRTRSPSASSCVLRRRPRWPPVVAVSRKAPSLPQRISGPFSPLAFVPRSWCGRVDLSGRCCDRIIITTGRGWIKVAMWKHVDVRRPKRNGGGRGSTRRGAIGM